MSGRASATIEISGREAPEIRRCVEPEVRDLQERYGCSVEVDGDSLYFELQVEDLVGMRASLNTWLRFVEVASDALGDAEGSCETSENDL